MFYCEKGLKNQCFTAKKGVHFELESQCFITTKASFSAEKSVFCRKIGVHFQTGEQRWVPLFPVSEGGSRDTNLTWDLFTVESFSPFTVDLEIMTFALKMKLYMATTL